MQILMKLKKSNLSCLIWVLSLISQHKLLSKFKIFYIFIFYRDLAGKNYFTELAKEVEKFLVTVIDKFGGVLALVDIYCMYNRARGTDLISPEDLLIACNKLNTISEKVILRTYASGVKVM